MVTTKFKTNIKCGGCIAAVTPALDTLSGIAKWEVDTVNPDKILTVESNEGLTPNEVIRALKSKGYNAEKI
ncbi:copper chaperone [Mucilaginibacter sp. UYP25]|uniref:heavy-metal-associated domain-containing protein n=1 Tax=unclassified Mucilaginibacter TaxID=2617802 RepID=UPI0033932C29